MKQDLEKILNHPDKDDIITKLTIGIPEKEINEWLASKYTSKAEKSFIISLKFLKNFKENYLDVYHLIREDIQKVKSSPAERLDLTLNDSSAYRNLIIKTAEQELDIKRIIKNLCMAIELRFSQIFDSIQENPKDINPRIDRLVMEYSQALGDLLEKCYQFTEEQQPQNVVNNNVTLQVVDQHVNVFYEAIKNTLAEMDVEKSLQFMEIFQEKLNKIKSPDKDQNTMSQEEIFTEVKVLNSNIAKRLHE